MRPKVFIPVRNDDMFACLDQVRDGNGVPLWRAFLATLEQFDLFIDTDSPSIKASLDEDRQIGAVTYLREPGLCRDQVTTNDLIAHFLDRYRIQHEVIAQIHLTHPFLEPATLHAAWACLTMESTYDSVLSCDRNQARLWSCDASGFFPINHNPMSLRRTRDLAPFFRENSAFYIFSAARFRALGNRLGLNPRFFEIPIPESITVGSAADWTALAGLHAKLSSWINPGRSSTIPS